MSRNPLQEPQTAGFSIGKVLEVKAYLFCQGSEAGHITIEKSLIWEHVRKRYVNQIVFRTSIESYKISH